ncbi:uncharacterized protein LOC121378263 [Gigantopelta aegis]|uniref:uncharacterized protein LOC121378263 n=1 Tax=Gigantopelta aegis TaxID=1735272 RepID=UPI001B888289|nr:uncharacterized protein LOC121378263 [Gigantopelta aegis]XP_041362275.1 uncharacterized protein LOC121378263 [Gigantopelta aegis]
MQNNPKHNLSKRIQEFELWRDEKGVIKNIEYAQRRSSRRSKFKELNRDRRLRCWKRLYVPSLFGILMGSVVLLCSSVYSMGHNTLFWDHKNTFYIVGSVMLFAGVILLLIAAGLTYKREQVLRSQLGLPEMFSQAWKPPSTGCGSSWSSTRSTGISRDAKDNSSTSEKKHVRRETSMDSAEMSTFLESSTSSPLTDVTWLEMSTSSSGRFPDNMVNGKVLTTEGPNNVLFVIHSKDYCVSGTSSEYQSGISEHDQSILDSPDICTEICPMLPDSPNPIPSAQSRTTVRSVT